MKKLSRCALLLGTFLTVSAWWADAQVAPTAGAAPAPPWQAASEQDHQRTMDLLHISTLRPGADNNHPDSPNAVNYDESKGNPYATLPDPLKLKDGRKVTSAAMWWQQARPQIATEIDEVLYGRVPAHTPKVQWHVVSRSRWAERRRAGDHQKAYGSSR